MFKEKKRNDMKFIAVLSFPNRNQDALNAAIGQAIADYIVPLQTAVADLVTLQQSILTNYTVTQNDILVRTSIKW